ncbi:hypothetical protein [Chryseolinea lacunae]|uniref:Uncharacterized protein n=1 Tax=Chryseolinea lacunae TaxID=2801331 RepID=A0ABS1KZG2_9BACT|nr:hypothetical protein [Chryseolinea lacunae]MBL0744840.1 hypothetical protein [Chryseolinea lacunae]
MSIQLFYVLQTLQDKVIQNMDTKNPDDAIRLHQFVELCSAMMDAVLYDDLPKLRELFKAGNAELIVYFETMFSQEEMALIFDMAEIRNWRRK